MRLSGLFYENKGLLAHGRNRLLHDQSSRQAAVLLHLLSFVRGQERLDEARLEDYYQALEMMANDWDLLMHLLRFGNEQPR